MSRKLAVKATFERKQQSRHGVGTFELIDFEYRKYSKGGLGRRILVRCVKHDNTFDISSSQHLAVDSGGCPQCKSELSCIARYNKYLPLIEKFHGDKYIYQKPESFGLGGKLKIICKEHGEFEKRIGDHLREGVLQGCPECTPIETAFSYSQFMSSCERNGNPTLYVLRCFNDEESFIKVGITGKGVESRYRGQQAMPYQYEVLNEYKGTPEEVWNLEKLIGRLFRKDFGYRPKIRFKGSMYECYKFNECSSSDGKLLV